MANWRTFARATTIKIWKLRRRVDLVTEIQDALTSNGFDIESYEVSQSFDRIKSLVSRQLSQMIEEAESTGSPVPFRFSSTYKDILLPLQDQSVDGLREQLSRAVRRLPWRPFEHFCVYVLRMQGVTHCEAMRGRKEQGIDFVGELNLGESIGRPLWHGARLRIIGQSKTNKLDQETVRLFKGDMEDFAKGEGSYHLAPEWFKAISGPLQGIVFTAREATRGAKNYGRLNHIVVRDGQQLVEPLVQSRVAPGLSMNDSELRFSEREFLTYFRKLSANEQQGQSLHGQRIPS
jgi:hypothetical protein